jgi:NAD(P)-dependent dehydrogenase (short-subunit alcohol dehydrogenase family)
MIMARFLANAAVALPSLNTPQPKEDFTPESYAEMLFGQSIDEWDKLLRINLTAVYFSSVAFIPLLGKYIVSYPSSFSSMFGYR